MEVENIEGSIGQAYGIRMDKGAVVSAVLNVEKVKSSLSLRHLDECLLFKHIWITSLNIKPTKPLPQQVAQAPIKPIQTQVQALKTFAVCLRMIGCFESAYSLDTARVVIIVCMLEDQRNQNNS